MCGPEAVRTYRRRLSGPLLDRLDIHVSLPRVDLVDLEAPSGGESSAVVRERVERARADLPITRGQWYTLEVAIKADTAACRVNGVTLFEHRAASSYHGYVGLWTKADSVTLFTGLTIENG